jgi:hypothetical protein
MDSVEQFPANVASSMTERRADMAEAPGGSTGWWSDSIGVCRQCRSIASTPGVACPNLAVAGFGSEK